MKTVKIFMIAFLACATFLTAKADDRPITVEQLPAAAREFIDTYFKDVQVSYATVDDEGYFGQSYEVNFMGGAEVEFDSNGVWKEVNCRREPVPAGIVPEQIVNFVNQHHAGQTITKIEKGRRDYEVELRNGLEIKFDRNFNMIGYDD